MNTNPSILAVLDDLSINHTDWRCGVFDNVIIEYTNISKNMYLRVYESYGDKIKQVDLCLYDKKALNHKIEIKLTKDEVGFGQVALGKRRDVIRAGIKAEEKESRQKGISLLLKKVLNSS